MQLIKIQYSDCLLPVGCACEITGRLPKGLMFNKQTGVLTGYPLEGWLEYFLGKPPVNDTNTHSISLKIKAK